jgi:hypothetical protein
MKLELKNLLPYLPYELKFLYNGNIYKMRWINSTGDIEYDSQKDFIDPFPPNVFNKELDLVKLMLRPLSDLTKEIEINGERFVPYEKLKKMYPIDTFSNTSNTAQWSYRIIQKLAEWHFDFQGLIPAGLAIDINNLNK